MANETLLNDTTTMTTDVPSFQLNNTVISPLPITSVVTLVYCIIGLIANSIVIVVIIWGSLRSSVFMTVLLALAIADNLALVAKILIQGGIFGYVTFGKPLLFCSLFFGLLQGSETMSSWLTVLASAERMVAICYPLNCHLYCNMKKSYISFATFSIFITIGSAPQFFIRIVSLSNGEMSCRSAESSQMYNTIYKVLFCLFYSIIPFICITTMNTLLAWKIHSQKKMWSQTQCKKNSSSLTMMMFTISFVFLVTTLPAVLIEVINGLCWIVKSNVCFSVPKIYMKITYYLKGMNHCVNFFLYCLTGSMFRQKLVQLLSCTKRNQG